MSKLTYSFGIILSGLLLGYIFQILVRREIIQVPISTVNLRKLLQRAALLCVNPIVFVGAIWIVNMKNVSLVALPFVGLFALLAGGALTLMAARLLKLESKRIGALYGCGSFTNIGNIGAACCCLACVARYNKFGVAL